MNWFLKWCLIGTISTLALECILFIGFFTMHFVCKRKAIPDLWKHAIEKQAECSERHFKKPILMIANCLVSYCIVWPLELLSTVAYCILIVRRWKQSCKLSKHIDEWCKNMEEEMNKMDIEKLRIKK